MPRRVLIMGAAGRDFHNFNVAYRGRDDVEVVAFTATQIPFIDDRTYPAALAGDRYPKGIPIHPEEDLGALIGDLERQKVTVEEREEYEPHLARGTTVYAGVDYGAILERAQAECDVLIWDGGNNDLPFYRPSVHLVVADPLRAGHELSYHPGETN